MILEGDGVDSEVRADIYLGLELNLPLVVSSGVQVDGYSVIWVHLELIEK